MSRSRIGLCAGLMALATVSQAQLSPEAGRNTAVDTVRVYRDRLPIDLSRAPVAATDVADSLFSAERQAGIDDALDFVPGVLAQSRSGSQDVRITVRGFGARGAGDRSNSGTTRGIRILLDGFPITEPDGRTSLDFADAGALDKVRVVRSNTSALYGSASGGLIDLVTHAPFAGPFGEARATFGSFGFQKLQLTGGALSEGGSRFRVTGSDQHFDGWRQQSRNDATTVQASAILNPEAATAVEVYAAGTSSETQQPGALTRAEFDADPRQADPTYVAQNARRDNAIGRLAARVKHESVEQGVFHLGAYLEAKSLHRAERNRFRDFTRYHVGGNALYSYAFRTEERTRMRLTVGLDEAYQDGAVLFYDLVNGERGTNLVADQREAINNFGTYAELRTQVGRQWEFTAGGRYDLVSYIVADHLDPALDDERTLNSFTPRLAAQYRVRPSQTLYVAFSGGLEPPAFNEVDPPPEIPTTALNPFLKPARSLTVEVGTKGLWLLQPDGARRIRYDVAIYGLEVRNDIIPYDGGTYYFQAGKSRRAGLELGLQFEDASGFSARFAGTFSHNRYIDYANDLGDFSGNESAGMPWLDVSVGARWDEPHGFYVSGDVQARSVYFADDANTAEVPAFGLFDATAGLRRRWGRSRIDGFVSMANVLDERWISSVFINGTNGRFYEPGLERNVFIGLSVRTE